MELNKNILTVPYSIIREFTEKAQKKGNAIMLTIGEPDLQPPREFIDYGYEYAKTHALGYTQAGGSNELRELVANHYNKYYGSNINDIKKANIIAALIPAAVKSKVPLNNPKTPSVL